MRRRRLGRGQGVRSRRGPNKKVKQPNLQVCERNFPRSGVRKRVRTYKRQERGGVRRVVGDRPNRPDRRFTPLEGTTCNPVRCYRTSTSLRLGLGTAVRLCSRDNCSAAKVCEGIRHELPSSPSACWAVACGGVCMGSCRPVSGIPVHRWDDGRGDRHWPLAVRCSGIPA